METISPMHRPRRPAGFAALIPFALLVLTACAPAGGGAEPEIAAPTGAAHPDARRVSIDEVLADPAAHVDEDITILENIDEEYVEDSAFVFSGTEVQGQLLVVLADGATVEKAVEPDRIVAVTGRIIPFTSERMEAAGLGMSIDDEALARYGGNAILVAARVADPLAP